jgi:hypothetical protein
LLSGGDPEILLQRKIQVVNPRIPDVRKITGRVPEGLTGVEGAGELRI